MITDTYISVISMVIIYYKKDIHLLSINNPPTLCEFFFQ